MGGRYSQIYAHFVFSTKYREPLIDSIFEERLYTYIREVGRWYGCTFIICGGISDHIHVVVGFKPSITHSKIVQVIKSKSSKWLNDNFFPDRSFAWQSGFGVFSIDKRNLDRVINYVNNQKEHHKNQTFETEYSKILRRYKLELKE